MRWGGRVFNAPVFKNRKIVIFIRIVDASVHVEIALQDALLEGIRLWTAVSRG